MRQRELQYPAGAQQWQLSRKTDSIRRESRSRRPGVGEGSTCQSYAKTAHHVLQYVWMYMSSVICLDRVFFQKKKHEEKKLARPSD